MGLDTPPPKTIKISKGRPQGRVLSPFLWNLVVDSLLELSCKVTPVYLQAFADDLVILAEGDDLDVIYNRMQKTIDTIDKWCTTNRECSAVNTRNTCWVVGPILIPKCS